MKRCLNSLPPTLLLLSHIKSYITSALSWTKPIVMQYSQSRPQPSNITVKAVPAFGLH